MCRQFVHSKCDYGHILQLHQPPYLPKIQYLTLLFVSSAVPTASHPLRNKRAFTLSVSRIWLNLQQLQNTTLRTHQPFIKSTMHTKKLRHYRTCASLIIINIFKLRPIARASPWAMPPLSASPTNTIRLLKQLKSITTLYDSYKNYFIYFLPFTKLNNGVVEHISLTNTFTKNTFCTLGWALSQLARCS